MKLVLATRNSHKLRELAPLMAPHELEPLPEDVELPPETATTFAGNALGKARAAAGATGLPAIADDSGIEAASLGGAPGVFSARYAGDGASDEENLAKLLREVPAEGDTSVAYVCALAYKAPACAFFRTRIRPTSTASTRSRPLWKPKPGFRPLAPT